jgi:hypothetical protein
MRAVKSPKFQTDPLPDARANHLFGLDAFLCRQNPPLTTPGTTCAPSASAHAELGYVLVTPSFTAHTGFQYRGQTPAAQEGSVANDAIANMASAIVVCRLIITLFIRLNVPRLPPIDEEGSGVTNKG